MILLLVLFAFGGASVESAHFAQCERLHFKDPACKAELSLCKLGPDQARCHK